MVLIRARSASGDGDVVVLGVIVLGVAVVVVGATVVVVGATVVVVGADVVVVSPVVVVVGPLVVVVGLGVTVMTAMSWSSSSPVSVSMSSSLGSVRSMVGSSASWSGVESSSVPESLEISALLTSRP